MKIFAWNPSLESSEETFLSDNTAVSATQFNVKNTNGFANGKRILVGKMSRERSELLTISGSPTNTQITSSTGAKFPHDADDPVYLLKYDKVRVYRSTTGETGAYSILATIDIDVDNADGKTWYEDANSLDTYWYKVSFFDSVASDETELSDAIQAIGYDRKQIGSVIADVAANVGDPDFIEMSQEEFLSNANDISEDLQTRAKKPYRFLKRKQVLNLGADSSTIDFPTDIWSINYLEANDNLGGIVRTFRPKKVSLTKALYDLSVTALGANNVREVAYDDEANQLVVVPKSLGARTGAFNLHYFKIFDVFTSFSTRIEGPTRRAYKLGLKRDFYLMKADSDQKYFSKANKMDQMYEVEVAKLQRTKNIDASGPSGFGADRKQYVQFGGPRYRQ